MIVPPRTRRSSVAVVATVTLATVYGVLPVFLLGGLAALVRGSLGFDEAILGLMASTFFAVGALMSVPSGRLSDRIGARRSLQLGMVCSTVALLGIALVASSWRSLMVCMAIGGMGNAIIQPSANLALARGVGVRRQGISFGIKQAAVPGATLLAGAAVPMVGLTVGWRWAFGGVVLAMAPIVGAVRRFVPSIEGRLVLRRRRAARDGAPGAAVPERPRATLPPGSGRQLLVVAIAGGCGAASANALGAFSVESAVAAGQPLTIAGILLSVGSASAISARLLTGWLADRLVVDQFRVVAGMMLVGALGLAALSAVTGRGALAMVMAVTFAIGWGWPGLLHLAVTREHMVAPAAAIGRTQAGIFLGGVVGPSAFGWAVRVGGYPLAWRGSAVVLVFAGLLLWASRRRAGAG